MLETFWYPNVKVRACMACLRMIVGPDFAYKLDYPGTSDGGEERIDTFMFDDGEEEVSTHC
jgi:hypothetical protein